MENPRTRLLLSFFRDPLNVIALACALAWGLMAVFGRPIGDFGVETDFYGDFVPQAKKWMEQGAQVGNGYRGPLYYLLLGVLGSLFRDYFMVGKLISVFTAAAGLRVAGGLIRRLWDPTAAVCGTLFIAATPSFVEYTFRACTDPFFWLLFVGSLSLLFTERHVLRNWIIAGGMVGLASLTRANGLILIFAALLVAIVLLRPLSRAVRTYLAFLATCAVLMAPWSLFLWTKMGDPFWSNNFRNIAMEVYASTPDTAIKGRLLDAVDFTSLGEVWAVYPLLFLKTMLANVYGHARDDVVRLVRPAWAVVAALGLVLNWRSWLGRRNLAFVGVGILVYVSLLPIFYNPRFMLPLLPWWGAAAGGLGSVAVSRLPRLDRFKGIDPGRILWAVMIPFVCMTAWSTFREISQSLDPMNNKCAPKEILGLARAVKQTDIPITSSTPVAARKPQIGYYLGAPVVSIPFGTMDDLRETGAHYMLISGSEVSSFPSLMPLIYIEDPAKSPPGLRLLARYNLPVRGQLRAALLFAVENPKSWNPPSGIPVRPEPGSLPGMSRIDYLRFRLARWYLNHDSTQPVDAVIGLLSDEAKKHPSMLLLLGDKAVRARNTDEAEQLYRRAMGEAPGPEVSLRLAGLYVLTRDRERLDKVLADYSTQYMGGAQGLREWYELGVERFASGEITQALAPLCACAIINKNAAPCLKTLSDALTALTWYDQAAEVLAEYVKLKPDDAEAKKLLESLQEQSTSQTGR